MKQSRKSERKVQDLLCLVVLMSAELEQVREELYAQ